MGAPARIFVSHSSKDNPFAQEVSDLIGAPPAAGAAAYQMLIDIDSLEDGRPWPIQLHEMMADCHAAVVLLTASAAASDWVLKETTILTWRQSLEKGFKVFIVQFPEVTDAALAAAGYAPLQHRLIQNLAVTTAADIAARVRAGLDADAVRPAETLYDRLAKRLADVIEQIGKEVLVDIVDKMAAERPPWRPGVDEKRALVERIACRIVRGELGNYASLKDLMNDVKATKLSTDNLRLVLRLAAPYWIDAQAAAGLSGLIEEAGGVVRCRAAALNAHHAKQYTGRMYVYRAFPLAFEYRVHGANPALAGDTLDHHTKKICTYCRKHLARYEDMEDDEIVADLAQGEPWLFVVISPLDRRALEALRARFPSVRFIIEVAGDTLDAAALPPGVVCLRPALDTQVEVLRAKEYGPADNIVTA